jgi:hypothetical protein
MSHLGYRHNIFKNLASFICAYFINFRFNVCVLATLIICICSSYFGYCVCVRACVCVCVCVFLMSENNWSHKCATNYQTYLEKQLNNFWKWNNRMLVKYHTGFSAELVRIIWAQFGGYVLGTPRLTALKLFTEKVFSSDHNNNLK